MDVEIGQCGGRERWSASFDDDVDVVLSATAVRWWEWMCPKTSKKQNLTWATNGGTGTTSRWSVCMEEEEEG